MAELPGLDPCVHCGLCLQACPTFVETADESDSPRGRIVLMRRWAEGLMPIDDPLLGYHLDRCLGCRACETACPAGVAYGHSLEAFRAHLVDRRGTDPLALAVLRVMSHRGSRRILLGAARMARPILRRFAGRSRLGFALGMLGATRMKVTLDDPQPTHLPAQRHDSPTPRGPAVVFRGCIMEGLFSHVNDATARVLAINGFDVAVPDAQGCCGALHAHAGRREEARELARRNVSALADNPTAPIVVNSAGCGATLKEYGELLCDDPLEQQARAFADRVCDVSELLAQTGPRTGAPLPLTVALDAPCHLHHAQRVIDAPRRVLAAIPELDIAPLAGADDCCGSAGLYSMLQRDLSLAILDRKLDAIAACGADVVATGNPGCIMHIGAGLTARHNGMPVVHPVELLDWSYRLANMTPDLPAGR